jgi:hypothetical protein
VTDENVSRSNVDSGVIVQRHQLAIHNLLKLAGGVNAQRDLELRYNPFAGANFNGAIIDGHLHHVVVTVFFTFWLRLLDFWHGILHNQHSVLRQKQGFWHETMLPRRVSSVNYFLSGET